MAQGVEDMLCSILKNTEFALQLGESALPRNEAILLAYMRFMKQEGLVQELLFAKELTTDTKGESIFKIANEFFKEKQVPVNSGLAVATDRPLSMYVIRAMNRIKANGLYDRLFRQLCEESDEEEFNRLFLHIEFNGMNVQLQSNELNLNKMRLAFLSKLMLYKCNFARGEFCQFSTLAKASKEVKILEDDVHIYCQHLEMLHEDFLRDIYLQEELIDLQSNEETKPRMAGPYDYWLEEQIPPCYPALWRAMKTLPIAIPSASVVERGFSVVTDLATNKSLLELIKATYDCGSRQCSPMLRRWLVCMLPALWSDIVLIMNAMLEQTKLYT
ncbi:LOW QUALITY PROTEIN: hypothetical protein M514_02465 [Trichuris suis]|uniref:HAT C-terminal dimerisation domain-containing protein n=1 Tax=Trichuris suis TaxID=68888 RepID=A0A085NF88_9BILA|nr:LOW QUALITY PROTEIN: hypothetical protein M513_02465 [Trichuris suis]KFD68134.1 LOW QUALITY PROTEIN: hypothetical protein M514_02465 [Trichuris suis]